MKQFTKRLDKNAAKVVRASFKEPVSLSLSDNGEVNLPREIRLFKLGANETTKGTFWLADWSIEACLHAENERNVDYPINKNHSYAEAYGWFNLSRGESGHLYANKPRSKPDMDGIWWLDTEAVEEVKKGQWRYTSAEFWCVPEWVEDEDGYIVEVNWWIVEIVGLALTNYPATHNAQPLILSDGISKDVPYFAQMSAKSPLEFKQMSELAKKEKASNTAPVNNPAPTAVTTQPTQEQLMSVWAVACEVTKKSSAPEVCGVLRAHASSHESLMELSQELNNLKRTQAEQVQANTQANQTKEKNEKLERATKAVDLAISEFKVRPDKRETTLALAGENGEKVEELEAHLAALYPILAPGPVQTSSSKATNLNATGNALAAVKPVSAPVILSDSERTIAKNLGLTEQEFADQKKADLN